MFSLKNLVKIFAGSIVVFAVCVAVQVATGMVPKAMFELIGGACAIAASVALGLMAETLFYNWVEKRERLANTQDPTW